MSRDYSSRSTSLSNVQRVHIHKVFPLYLLGCSHCLASMTAFDCLASMTAFDCRTEPSYNFFHVSHMLLILKTNNRCTLSPVFFHMCGFSTKNVTISFVVQPHCCVLSPHTFVHSWVVLRRLWLPWKYFRADISLLSCVFHRQGL
jgi:hypothetical protein